MDLPQRMLFQWHITERCNAFCKHCYQEHALRPESPYSELIATLDQIVRFVRLHGDKLGQPTEATLTLTGGEPFVHPDFFRLLDAIANIQAKAKLKVAILTNGMLIDRDVAKKLKGYDLDFVQVSIEGREDTHDQIRGRGSYQQTIRGIESLIAEGIPTYVSFTAHRLNYREFGDVAHASALLGVTRVWSDRLIPMGSGDELRDSVLTPEETLEYVELMSQARGKQRKGKTEVALHRALQFAGCDGQPYNCKAGWSLLTLLPGGELVPCRRMPIPVGNFLMTGLWELYQHSILLKELRDRDRQPEGCKSCFYVNFCKGGLKCLAHATTGDPWSGDPGCWILKRNQQNRQTEECHGCL